MLKKLYFTVNYNLFNLFLIFLVTSNHQCLTIQTVDICNFDAFQKQAKEENNI